MEVKIARRYVRHVEEIKSLSELPAMSGIRFIGRLIRHDEEFISYQYVLYYEGATYTLEVYNEADYLELTLYLDSKFKEAGKKPKVAIGTIEPYLG